MPTSEILSWESEPRPEGRPTSGALPRATLELVQVLVERARGDDKTALPLLRRLFDQHGEQLIELGRGDVARAVRVLLADKASRRRNILETEARLRKADQIGAELAGPNPTPIERLLAERAAYCWLEVHVADEQVLGQWDAGMDRTRAAMLDQHRDRAQRRYLAALKTLAVVRKLVVPSIQVNMANQQVNQFHAAAVGP